jgi:hypothetical protein
VRITFIIFFCTLLFSISSQNNLNLYSVSGDAFNLYTNGKLINEIAQASVLNGKIMTDTLRVKVEFANKLTGEGIIYLLEKGKPIKNTEFNYSIDVKNNKVKFNFEGTKQIVDPPNPLVPLKPVVDTTFKYRNNVLGHYCELKDGKAMYFNNLPKTGDCVIPMPAAYINYLNILMAKAQIDDDKFSIAENTTRNNCYNVAQLNKILLHIVFEIEKIKLIKLSYFHLTDKQNVKNLDSTFKLESSKRELAVFLKNTDQYKVKSGVNCLTADKTTDIDQFAANLGVYPNDTERFAVFKKVYSDHCYSVAQAKLILNQFIHDREKLDAAKLLYFYSIEKNIFLSLSDVFSYTSSASELKEFIDKQQN